MYILLPDEFIKALGAAFFTGVVNAHRVIHEGVPLLGLTSRP